MIMSIEEGTVGQPSGHAHPIEQRCQRATLRAKRMVRQTAIKHSAFSILMMVWHATLSQRRQWAGTETPSR